MRALSCDEFPANLAVHGLELAIERDALGVAA